MKSGKLLAVALSFVLVAGFVIPAYAGAPQVCLGSSTLGALLADPTNCILVDDKTFTNFRNYQGNYDPNQIQVFGLTLNGEKGLRFIPASLFVSGPPSINIVFDYDVISSGDPISDNTMTLDSFNVNDPSLSTTTRVEIEEKVYSDISHNSLIATKFVFFNAAGLNKLSHHIDYLLSHQMVSVNVDILLNADNCAIFPVGTCIVVLDGFTQTFSQEEQDNQIIGGKILSLDTTSLLLVGAQSISWMIPVTLSVLGIGLFVVSRKSEN